MLKSEVFPYYRDCVKQLTSAYNLIKERFSDDDIENLRLLRGYAPDSPQLDLFAELKIGCCEYDSVEDFGSNRRELGLVSDKDNFLLSNRYIIPVTDVADNLTALIGYYPDYKKYITTPSPFFSKETMFFNFNQAYKLSWEKYDGFVILVEGIFDCLSLRSIGLPAIATMGASVSALKKNLLKCFRKVLAIPDDDSTGKKALNRYNRGSWQVPNNTTFLQFSIGDVQIGGESLHCKDMDNFVTWFEANDVREILLSYKDSNEDVEVFKL